MKNNRCIYQIAAKKSGVPRLLYPPIATDPNTDYICFTDIPNLSSKYWDILYSAELGSKWIEGFLQPYEEARMVQPNQIQVAPVFEDYNALVSIPALDTFADIPFDLKKFVPTAGEDGAWHYDKNPVPGNQGGNKRGLLLTIGVPVSNQIHTIARCLQHIRPLLDKLDAELLAINTGSTDGTVECCKSYGARIIEYPWCDNMSAVRNTGIYHALGEWYLSIDDDEWFEDVDGILDFFLTGTYRQYDTATYIQRNYNTSSGESWYDSHTLRMARITPELHFEGRIHDAMVVPASAKNCPLSSYAHHYGFVKDDPEKSKKKFLRNASLLLYDMYEYPQNLRYNFQLAKEFNAVCDYERAILFFLRGISIERELGNPYYGKNHAIYLFTVLYNARDSRMFAAMSFLEKKYPFTPAEKALAWYMKAEFGWSQGHSASETLAACEKYEAFLKQFQDGPGESLRLACVGLEVCTEKSYPEDIKAIKFCCLSQGSSKEALEVLEQAALEHVKEGKRPLCNCLVHTSDELFEAGMEKLAAVLQGEWAKEMYRQFIASLEEASEIKKLYRQRQRFRAFLKYLSIDTIRYSLVLCPDTHAGQCWIDIVKEEMQGFTLKTSSLGQLSVQELYFFAEMTKKYMEEQAQKEELKKLAEPYKQLAGNFTAAYYHPSLLKDRNSKAIPGVLRQAYDGIC